MGAALAALLLSSGCSNVSVLRKTINREMFHENRYTNLCVPKIHPTFCNDYKRDLEKLRRLRAEFAEAVKVGGAADEQKAAVEELLDRIDSEYADRFILYPSQLPPAAGVTGFD